MRWILLLVVCLISISGFCQKKIHHPSIGTMNGGEYYGDHASKKVTYVSTVTYKHNTTIKKYYPLTKENEKKILLIGKYIDTLKPIYLLAGTNRAHLSNLKGNNYISDFSPLPPLKIYIRKGQLFISVDILDIDQKNIADVTNNVLTTGAKAYKQYASDSYIEVYNEYNVPVFQCVLDKKSNTIILSGLFFHKDGYVILSNTGGMIGSPYPDMKKNSDLT